MRIWYQSFARASERGNYGEALRVAIRAAADPGTDIEIHAIERGGGVGDQYRYLEYRDTREVIENAMRAEREGFDAFLLGNILDPGIDECRELLRIPVLGLCETNLHIACMMGRRYGIVTVNPKFTPRILENVRRYGLWGQMAAVELMHVTKLSSLSTGFVAGEGQRTILDQFESAARSCLAQGAEVLFPAGGTLMALLSHLGIREVDGAPILDGIATLLKMGETAVKLRGILGTFTSKALTYRPPAGDVLDEVRRFYGPDVYA